MSNNHEKSEAGQGGLTVAVRNNDVEKAIRILKKKINTDGILKELRKKEYYEKPSVRRRREQAEAVNRWRKTERTLRDEL